jgi:hypothetical protein
MAQLSPFSTLDREGAEEGPPAESVSPVTDSAECIGVLSLHLRRVPYMCAYSLAFLNWTG